MFIITREREKERESERHRESAYLKCRLAREAGLRRPNPLRSAGEVLFHEMKKLVTSVSETGSQVTNKEVPLVNMGSTVCTSGISTTEICTHTIRHINFVHLGVERKAIIKSPHQSKDY